MSSPESLRLQREIKRNIASSGGGSSSITWGSPTHNTIGTSNQEILAATASDRNVLFTNNAATGGGTIYLNVDAVATATNNILVISPKGTYVLEGNGKKAINIVGSNAGIPYTYQTGA